jgi:hypothetical protein
MAPPVHKLFNKPATINEKKNSSEEGENSHRPIDTLGAWVTLKAPYAEADRQKRRASN